MTTWFRNSHCRRVQAGLRWWWGRTPCQHSIFLGQWWQRIFRWRNFWAWIMRSSGWLGCARLRNWRSALHQAVDITVACLTMIFFLRKALLNSWCQCCPGDAKVLLKNFALGELFTCAKPTSHDSERNEDLCIESWLYQSAKLTHCKNFVQACGQHYTPVTTAWTRRSTWPSSALMLATIMYFKYHTIFRKIGSKFRVLQSAPSWGMPEHQPTYHAASHLVANSYSTATCK